MDKEAYFTRGQEIVRRLNELTYEAYFVGGVVRDYLLKKDFTDIDIATSATPEQIYQEFPTVDMTYASRGCVTLTEGEFKYEISTFKEETYLNRTRNPNMIHFSMHLMEDINRRDFTINAIAMTDNLDIVDLCGGKKDLEKKTIRVIGKPKKRFQEDPLRILRAYELMARFNFHFAFNTSLGINKCTKLLPDVSEQKVSTSLEKIFDAPYGKKAVKKMVSLGTNEGLYPYEEGLRIIAKKYKKLTTNEKFALCYKCYGSVPENTCFEKNRINFFKKVIEVANATECIPMTRIIVFNYDKNVLLAADKVNTYTVKAHKSQAKLIEKYAATMPIKSINDMEFKGFDLVSLAGGVSGTFIGEIMQKLREKVIMKEIPNDYTILKREAKILLAEWRSNKEPQELKDNLEKAKEERDKTTLNAAKEEKVADDMSNIQNFTKYEPKDDPSDILSDFNEEQNMDIEKLRAEFTEAFDHLMALRADSIKESEISEEQKQAALTQLAIEIKEKLCEADPKYNVLFQEEEKDEI